MQIEIVAIGNEVLAGITVNTNAAFISRILSRRGYSATRHIVIPDDREGIRKNVVEALARSELVIATGGLGPTIDDLTREAVKGLFDTQPVSLPNHVGTALGLAYFANGKGLILLPGVPREMEEMFAKEAISWIERHFIPPFEHVYSFSLCLFKESEIDPYLRDLKNEHPEIDCGIYPARGTLRIVLRSRNKNLHEIGKRFEEKFPTFVFHEASIQRAVHKELITKKQTLALAESCTGGAITASLVALPDTSYFLLGSFVVYSNEWKEQFLGVSSATLRNKGAVSRETVEEMIHGIFTQTQADFAIAVSGIAGPSGGTPEKPVGTIYIGIGKRRERSDIGKIFVPQDRQSALDSCVQTALSALWRRIVYNEPSFT